MRQQKNVFAKRNRNAPAGIHITRATPCAAY